MSYSLRVPLPGGKLKIKSKSGLRQREIERKAPLFNLLGMYLIWEPKGQDRSDRGNAPMF